MDLGEWSKSEVRHGRKLVSSGLEGARSGREAFLHGRHLSSYFSESVRNALKPAVFGACIGMLGACPRGQQKSIGRVLAFGLLGGALGFGVGIAREDRWLAASVIRGAMRNIDRARDENWMERHSIAYA